MNDNRLKLFCDWSYRKGRVGMVETIHSLFKENGLVSDNVIDLLEHIVLSEKKDLEKAETDLDKELKNGI